MNEITIAAILALAFMPAAAYADEFEEYCDCELAVPPAAAVDEEAEQPEAQPDEFVPLVSAEDFKWMGVIEYNGHCETYYSSRELYHPDTPSWTLDDDGFFRTSDGLFVVATDAYPYGTVIETSRGAAQVLDCGCGWNIDFYVDWE